MIAAERGDVYCDPNDDLAFAIAVRDGARRIVLRASSSSIHPRVEYDERIDAMNRFADRIVAAINKGGENEHTA